MKFIALLLCIVFTATGLQAFEPVNIWISSYQDKVYYESMILEYRKKNPEFQATVSAYGFREMPEKLAAAMQGGGTKPDIVQLDEVFFGLYLREDVPFVDLTARVKKAGLDKTLLPQRLSLFAHKKKQYGLPQSVSAVVMYYRPDLLKKQGLSVKDLATWDSVKKTAVELGKSSNPAILSVDWSYFEILLRQRGGELFDKDGKPAFTSPVAVDTLTYLKELLDTQGATLPMRGSIFDPAFFSGDIVGDQTMSIVGAGWYGLDMLQEYAADTSGKWRIAPLPAWNDKLSKGNLRTSTFAGQGLMIFKDSKVIDPAWKFIEFVMTDKEANVQRYLQGNSFPAHMPSWKDERLKQKDEFFGGQSLSAELMKMAPDVPVVRPHPLRVQFLTLFQESYFNSVVYGDLTPEEALKQLAEQITRP